jgi:branched-chain amino acid transport system substrate-binding protein
MLFRYIFFINFGDFIMRSMIFKTLALSALTVSISLAFAQTKEAAKPVAKAAAPAAAKPLAGQTVKIAMIEGLSGAFANVGQNQLKSYQFVAERYAGDKNPAGVKFEFVAFDNKGSPQATLDQLKAATDQGFRYVTQGNSSAVAGALSDAVAKHNERNPGKEVIYLNYAAVDPALTNERCNYWHFRLDADTSMKMEALTSFMKDEKSVKNVYLINQNYAHGQQVANTLKKVWHASALM